MERSDLLLTVAEIAIAFAGFASIVSVLGRQSSRDDPRLDAWRLRGMLEAALTVVLFALAPFIPDAFGLGGAATWRVTAVVFLIWNLTALILGGRRGRSLARQGVTTTSRGVLPLFVAMELLIDVPLVLVVSGFVPQVASALYLLALLAALLQAGFFFLRVIGSLLMGAAD